MWYIVGENPSRAASHWPGQSYSEFCTHVGFSGLWLSFGFLMSINSIDFGGLLRWRVTLARLLIFFHTWVKEMWPWNKEFSFYTCLVHCQIILSSHLCVVKVLAWFHMGCVCVDMGVLIFYQKFNKVYIEIWSRPWTALIESRCLLH